MMQPAAAQALDLASPGLLLANDNGPAATDQRYLKEGDLVEGVPDDAHAVEERDDDQGPELALLGVAPWGATLPGVGSLCWPVPPSNAR